MDNPSIGEATPLFLTNVFNCHSHSYFMTHVVRMNKAHNINTYHDPMCLRKRRINKVLVMLVFFHQQSPCT